MIIPAGSREVELIDSDDMVVLAMKRDGGFEREALTAWDRLAGAGGLMIDVGAYTGVYAIAAAKRGCEVVAFEPTESAGLRMLRNAAINDVDLDARQVALGDSAGSAEFWFNDALPMTSGGSLVAQRRGRITVPVRRLDDEIDGPVTAIKIDVEGGEEAVLRGASETIKQDHPAIIIELLDGSAKAFADRFLQRYRATRLDARNWLYEAI